MFGIRPFAFEEEAMHLQKTAHRSLRTTEFLPAVLATHTTDLSCNSCMSQPEVWCDCFARSMHSGNTGMALPHPVVVKKQA